MLVLAVMTLAPNTLAQEDHMTLDKQNYSGGDRVKMSGFIEGSGGHVITITTLDPSDKVMSTSHSYGSSDSFGIGQLIIGSSWEEDGIYKIIASEMGKEFVEIFGVNYALTESDTARYQQDQEKKALIKHAKNHLGNHVGVNTDKANYVQGGMLKIYGYGHSVDDNEVSSDESVTLKIYGKNSKILFHEAEVSLDKYDEFLYYLDTSDDTKWDYATQSAPPPFGTPRGFYDVVAEFAGSTNDRQFYLKATTEQDKQINAVTEQEKTSSLYTGHKVAEGDGATVKYEDNTLPSSYTLANSLDISSNSKIKIMHLSPLKQHESGVPLERIQCNRELVLTQKEGSGNLACVRYESIPKLIERGWIMDKSLFDPKITVENVLMQYDESYSKATLDISLEMFNPNNVTVTLDGVNVVLGRHDIHLKNEMDSSKLGIPAYSSKTLDASFEFVVDRYFNSSVISDMAEGKPGFNVHGTVGFDSERGVLEVGFGIFGTEFMRA